MHQPLKNIAKPNPDHIKRLPSYVQNRCVRQKFENNAQEVKYDKARLIVPKLTLNRTIFFEDRVCSVHHPPLRP